MITRAARTTDEVIESALEETLTDEFASRNNRSSDTRSSILDTSFDGF
jgi:hypothetical protein